MIFIYFLLFIFVQIVENQTPIFEELQVCYFYK
jgi:hypothetical protein